ncbi:hypothetical protein [Microbulbifer celer]|uniref:Uncharacterized protein n=1 Tax=Microbulbifer celer TaxID=435905 RepID=A0ABW3UFI7_9GAMM|nr:hypothetical protein [Microbulbifer celer]UFN56376.1 hypothetical protein LPW13_12445 [Microbulbifer celer]
MKLIKFFLGAAFVVSVQVNAASFNLDGKIIESDTVEEIVDCGSYKVRLKSEQFPYKYEMEIPEEYKIEGFYGSSAIVEKSAFIFPGGTRVLSPSEIKSLKSLYPLDRTYLPTSAVCKGSTLIVSYWSGGNCKECEAFLQFEVVDGKPTNAKKVHYGQVQVLKN